MLQIIKKYNIPLEVLREILQYLTYKKEFDQVINHVYWGVPVFKFIENNHNARIYRDGVWFSKNKLEVWKVISLANAEADIYTMF